MGGKLEAEIEKEMKGKWFSSGKEQSPAFLCECSRPWWKQQWVWPSSRLISRTVTRGERVPGDRVPSPAAPQRGGIQQLFATPPRPSIPQSKILFLHLLWCYKPALLVNPTFVHIPPSHSLTASLPGNRKIRHLHPSSAVLTHSVKETEVKLRPITSQHSLSPPRCFSPRLLMTHSCAPQLPHAEG